MSAYNLFMQNVNLPQYKLGRLVVDEADVDAVKSVDVRQDFMDRLRQEVFDRFAYEPKNEETIRGIGNCVAGAVRINYPCATIRNVDIDSMQDLDARYSECQSCAEAGSYEEYKLRRAAEGMPDAAGSEGEWFRMAQYSPGSVLVSVSFTPRPSARNVVITTKI